MTAPATARLSPVTPTDLPCRKLGSQCRALRVTLRVGSLEEGDTSLDHEATWLLGHTERITFGDLWWGEGDLYVEAVLHVPCRHLRSDGGTEECRLFGYRGVARRPPRRLPQPRRLGGNRFQMVESKRVVIRSLPAAPAPRHVAARAREREPMRLGPVPHLGPPTGRRLLQGSAGRDHVYQE